MVNIFCCFKVLVRSRELLFLVMLLRLVCLMPFIFVLISCRCGHVALCRFKSCTTLFCVQFVEDLMFCWLFFIFILLLSFLVSSPLLSLLPPHLPLSPAWQDVGVCPMLPADPMATINLVSLHVRGLYAPGK